jgi:beta-lactamase regulating signal transducer with metallopeptidase domain
MNYLWKTVSLSNNSFDLFLFLAALAVKVTFLLGVVALLCLALRRFSAATRHMLWTLSLCAALLLPFLSVAEVWDVPVLPAQISSLSTADSNVSARAADDSFLLPEEGIERSLEVTPEINEREPKIPTTLPAIHSVEKTLPVSNPSHVTASLQQGSASLLSKLINWALAIWLAGALLLLLRLLVGFISTKWLTRGAVDFKDEKLVALFSSLLTELRLKENVRLLRSERTLMPIVCGVFRPAVLLPASADDWSEERRKMVLLHELTHVARRDCLTQWLAQAACAFYWFNPLVWHAARRLRVEREQACDDYVLRIGTKPSDYAHHLLEIARYLQEHPVFQWSQTATVAMARQSQLEGRLLAILSREGKGRAMSQAMTAGMTALIAILFLSLAVIRPTVSSAQNPQISETSLDESANAADKSRSGLTSTTVSKSKGEALIQGVNTQESSRAELDNADAIDKSQEKILERAQVEQGIRQVLKSEVVNNVESKIIENTSSRIENFPVPVVMPETGLPVFPVIKANYQHEPDRQDESGDFINEMASVGYVNLSIKELINLKATGVTAEYVRSLRALGLSNLTPKEISGMSVNGVTREFIETIRNAGYRELTTRELLSFRIHGITPGFIDKLKTAGYSNLSPKQLIDFAVHSVTPEFINSMRSVGLGNLSPKELVTLRVHGITAEYVRAARKRLGDLTIKQIIALKIEGLLEGLSDQ